MRMPRISYHGCSIYETRVCTSIEEIAECQELMYVLLTGSFYGGQNVSIIRKWLGPIENHVYLGAYSKKNGSLQGVFRLIPDFNPTIHSNLYDDVLGLFYSGQRLIDVGAYISPFKKERPSIFEALFTITAQYLFTREINGVYIQVKEDEVPSYTGLGFSPASIPFQPPGWNHYWTAMFMRFDQITQQYTDLDFQTDWRGKTSVDFRFPFWHRVMAKIKTRQDWVIAEN